MSVDALIPASGRIHWHEADSITGVADGGNVSSWPEKFGNGKDLACASSYPTFETNILNGMPAVNFDGSQNPLNWTGAIVPKHVFVVCAFADAAFPAPGGAQEYAGIYSGIANGSNGVLIGNPSSTKWFDLGFSGGGVYTFHRRDVAFTESLQESSMSGAISIFEVSLDIGIAIDGIQIGQDRAHSTRKWKGPIVAAGAFSRVLASWERHDVYEYLAIRYLLWKRVSSGLDVWPFEPNYSFPLSADKPVLSSISVDRSRKSRSKGSYKLGIQPQFESRDVLESDAAISFWDAKYPGTSFIYRDNSFSPAREIEMVFTSGVTRQVADAHDVNYTWQAEEV